MSSERAATARYVIWVVMFTTAAVLATAAMTVAWLVGPPWWPAAIGTLLYLGTAGFIITDWLVNK